MPNSRVTTAQSVDHHLILRIFAGSPQGAPVSEIHVHPESRHWFAHVERAGEQYAAELGCYKAGRKWVSIATSGTTLTPPDTISAETEAEFATLPVELPFAKLVALVKEAVQENLPLAHAVEELRKQGHPELPTAVSHRRTPVPAWTPAQEKALAEIVNIDRVQRIWIGSLEITELIRRKLTGEISSLGMAQFSLPTSPMGAVSSISSPFGGKERRKRILVQRQCGVDRLRSD